MIALLGIYIIGFIVMFAYTIAEIKDYDSDCTFWGYWIYIIGLLIWHIMLGMLMYQVKETINNISKNVKRKY